MRRIGCDLALRSINGISIGIGNQPFYSHGYCRSCPRRYSSDDGEAGYMKKRLQELSETNIVDKDDPLMKIIHGGSIVDESEALRKTHGKLEDVTFQEKHREQLSITKGSVNTNKHAQDIASSKSWRGDEHVLDTALRMVLDSAPKAIPMPNGSVNNRFKDTGRRKLSVQDRLEQVQDKTMRYKQDLSTDEIEKREAAAFRALYTEKFTPIGSFEKLRSVADARIEESIKRGEFNSTKKLHGKKVDVSNENAHLDRTTYHLNNILVKQNIVPPWIEKQGSVSSDIAAFRKQLVGKLETELLNQMRKRKLFSHAYATVQNALDSINTDRDTFLDTCFRSWCKSVQPFLNSNIPRLNSGLRSYNLQAPLHTQKLYLVADRELERARKSVNMDNLFAQEYARIKDLNPPGSSAKENLGSKDHSRFSLFNIFKSY
ncbi:hypothetical protein C6P41_002041 [Kluyveromyces marxianus]|nr:hypothetical protein C6P43_002333 [Kluyveromyces marxianus]KAG0684741.1 hypothetical protein C6P41_002041 [Kluyveromyces marxianus]